MIEPIDHFDAEWQRQAKPTDWKNPTPDSRYNLVVIGGGTAGLVAAAGAAGLGARVALVERSLMGGDCLNFGCVPSKAILRSARVVAAVRDSGSFGVHTDGCRIDFASVMERMRRLRSEISPNDSAERFRKLGVDVYLGDARFVGPDAVDVAGVVLKFHRAVIATGARPRVPEVPGLSEAGFHTNETIFSLTELPRRLVVVGTGPIGCELAQAFARFGSSTTIIGTSRQLLPKEDAAAADLVRRSLERDGVALRLGWQVDRVETVGGAKRLQLRNGDGVETVDADVILVAIGRQPNVGGLDLQKAGVEYDLTKGVVVDDRLRTTNPRIYASGDVCSKFQFTHAADAMSRIVLQNSLFYGRAKAGALQIPRCTYTSPEIAAVGLTEREADEQSIKVDLYTQELRDVDRAILDGEMEGFVRILTRKGTDEIVGATIVAENAGDMIATVALAMRTGVGLAGLGRTIFPYPTQSEAIRKIADAYSRTRLTPTIKWLFGKWLAWNRRG